MSKVLFKGQNAGLSHEARGGDSNSPYDYFVTCGCGAGLGVLGAFSTNPEGRRSIYCGRCHHLTIMKDAQVERYVDVKSDAAQNLLFRGAKAVAR
jgi:hypothetical protein